MHRPYQFSICFLEQFVYLFFRHFIHLKTLNLDHIQVDYEFPFKSMHIKKKMIQLIPSSLILFLINNARISSSFFFYSVTFDQSTEFLPSKFTPRAPKMKYYFVFLKTPCTYIILLYGKAPRYVRKQLVLDSRCDTRSTVTHLFHQGTLLSNQHYYDTKISWRYLL